MMPHTKWRKDVTVHVTDSKSGGGAHTIVSCKLLAFCPALYYVCIQKYVDSDIASPTSRLHFNDIGQLRTHYKMAGKVWATLD